MDCTCDECKAMCVTPCWPTPAEARELMRLGYTDRMMLDFWVGPDAYIYIVCPAERGHEGGIAGWVSSGGCAFQTEEGLCEVHDVCKPIEGREAICRAKRPTEYPKAGDMRKRVKELWDTPAGYELVAQFEKFWEQENK